MLYDSGDNRTSVDPTTTPRRGDIPRISIPEQGQCGGQRTLLGDTPPHPYGPFSCSPGMAIWILSCLRERRPHVGAPPSAAACQVHAGSQPSSAQAPGLPEPSSPHLVKGGDNTPRFTILPPQRWDHPCQELNRGTEQVLSDSWWLFYAQCLTPWLAQSHGLRRFHRLMNGQQTGG